MVTALTDVSSYAQQTGLTTPQLQSIGDVNRDGKFNNVDIQSLLDKVAGRQGAARAPARLPVPPTKIKLPLKLQ